MNDFLVSYVSLPETTPKDELSALAAVYRFVIDRHAKKGDPTKDAAHIGHKQARNVDQRPDRPSGIRNLAARYPRDTPAYLDTPGPQEGPMNREAQESPRKAR